MTAGPEGEPEPAEPEAEAVFVDAAEPEAEAVFVDAAEPEAEAVVIDAAEPEAEAVFIDAAELAESLDGPGPAPVLLDVRWQLARPDGRPDFAAGHIAGARFVDLETELSDSSRADAGRHPLPTLERARQWAATVGLGPDTPTVVYDDWNGLAAGRAWWVLRWIGASDVRILDGGLSAWTACGGELIASDGDSARPRNPDPAVLEQEWSDLDPAMTTMTADDAARWPGAGVLLDARAPARYQGEEEPVDPRAGHVPGAMSLPASDLLDDSGRRRPGPAVRERLRDVGVRPDRGTGPVGVYCGSGIAASWEIAVLASVGVPATLFAGSWSQWSADPTRDVAVGSEPGDPAPVGSEHGDPAPVGSQPG